MGLESKRLAGILVLTVTVLFFTRRTGGEEVCDSPLVSNLQPSSFRSSSQLSNIHGPGYAKLNRREGAGGWSPLKSDRYQWVELDLGGRTQITAVATQGRYGSSDWLTSYLLMFSDTVISSNSNADSVIQYKLQQPVISRYLRLVPLDWNHPSGWIGLRLELYGCPYNSHVLSLNGESSLLYHLGAGASRMSPESISLKFKTMRNSGILLQAQGPERSGLTLELVRGRLWLLLRQGGGVLSAAERPVSLGSLLDDQHWHHVAVEWLNTRLNFTVDANRLQLLLLSPLTPRAFQVLSVGVASTPGPLKTASAVRSFQGCLENLEYNHLNLGEMAKLASPQVTIMGNVTFSCAEPVLVAVTFSSPQSFLQLPGASTSSLSLGLEFRTWNQAGLLLTFDLPQAGGVVWLHLIEARLRLQIDRAGRTLLELTAGSNLNDGQWHSAKLSSRHGRLTMTVDRDKEDTAVATPPFAVTTGSHLFFGGCPSEGRDQVCRSPFDVFQGCMRLLALDDQPFDLIMVQQRLLGNSSHLQIDMCGIIDRCAANHCEHGGVCSQSWSSFYCNCSHSGYTGATCHSPVFESSCEAYKHNGNTSGSYHIDVDGSGPIRAQIIYCNMTEEKTWMVVEHNNTELTRVTSPLGGRQYTAHFDYSSEDELLLAILSQSEHCEQELSYHCRRSRLLNTPDGSPFSWWSGGPGSGQVQNHWGGALPGSHQCSCGRHDNCLDPKYYCNCDADRLEWSSDSGLLTQKDSLPLRSLVLGDLHRPGSEATYRVGSLRCHGDKNLWNAVSFDTETSYLHFPTFHAQLSADIYFLFKTTASSGVFLENLGIKDFICIELSSSRELVFSFDVGNGPLEVRVEAASPLNDNRWHRVRAERNVKEAWLRVDQLPVATRVAPDDGHLRLQLNSQLFIGGTASRQKGFRGCIRSLQLNGVTVDLEARARITPGVRAGCPGHCSSYGPLCQNQGRCVERSDGFSCDCGLSAYTGVFCHREVSASFSPRTSVRYTFQEVHEQGSGASALPSSIYSEVMLREENISLSFRTSQMPALLLYVSSSHREHLALVVNKHDTMEVHYRLEAHRGTEVWRSRGGNMADGQIHSLTIRRVVNHVTVQIDQNAKEDFNLSSKGEFSGVLSLFLGRVPDSEELDPELSKMAALGFTGCLSVVQFNTISPLKAALLHIDTSPVTVAGPLVQSNCGSSSPANPYEAGNRHHLSDQSGSENTGQPMVNSLRSDSALIGGVIAMVFATVSGLAILARYLYRRKETYQKQEAKVVKAEDGSPDSHNVPGENTKQYFI